MAGQVMAGRSENTEMAEDEKKGIKMPPDLDLGAYLAFFLPGALTLYALIPLSTRIHDLFRQILGKDATVGASLLFLIGGLMVGTVISAVRALILDWIVQKPKFNYVRLTDPNILMAYKEAVANTYRFYQFYGNTLLALGFYLAVRYLLVGVDFRTERPLFYLGVFVFFVLLVQARRQLKGTYGVIGRILGLELDGLKICTEKLPGGKMNELYKCPLEAKDGTPPVKWTIAGGALPAGLALDACGGLAGAPTAQGTSQFTLRVDDAANGTQSKQFSITIDQ